jgi:hypothetical protein
MVSTLSEPAGNARPILVVSERLNISIHGRVYGLKDGLLSDWAALLQETSKQPRPSGNGSPRAGNAREFGAPAGLDHKQITNKLWGND